MEIQHERPMEKEPNAFWIFLQDNLPKGVHSNPCPKAQKRYQSWISHIAMICAKLFAHARATVAKASFLRSAMHSSWRLTVALYRKSLCRSSLTQTRKQTPAIQHADLHQKVNHVIKCSPGGNCWRLHLGRAVQLSCEWETSIPNRQGTYHEISI